MATPALKRSHESASEKCLSPEEKQAKINEVRKMMGSITHKHPDLFSDASITRYLRSRNWNTKKAGQMLIQTLKWRLEYRPDKIRWEEIAQEAEMGKIYPANYFDKYGRVVLVLRPGFQNTKAVSGQIRYLVYCMENAIKNLNSDQEQIVLLVDFNGWNSSSTSMKATRETVCIVQNHYPERLGLGILYNPPKIFESFWKLVKSFIEPKTFKKVKFVYPNNPQSQKIMEELFDKEKLESVFGGRNSTGFDYETYAQRMKEDDKKISNSCSSPSFKLSIIADSQQSELLAFDQGPECENFNEGESSSSKETSSSNLGPLDNGTVNGNIVSA